MVAEIIKSFPRQIGQRKLVIDVGSQVGGVRVIQPVALQCQSLTIDISISKALAGNLETLFGHQHVFLQHLQPL